MYDPTQPSAATGNVVSCYGPLQQRPQTPQTPQALDKPLPSLPSPTLTNPDMVLPHAGSVHAPDSPESLGGPPSISYLRDITNQDAGERASMDREWQLQQPAKKEKRSLMGRKMMLLRNRPGSAKKDDAQSRHDSPARQEFYDDNPPIASSPTIHDGDRLAPQISNDKRSSIGASSFNSEEYEAALPAFLSRYQSREETEDELTDTEKPPAVRMGYSCSIAGGADAQRKAQEEEEHNSAMLSQRAEQILANAKKRLNLMEGNLRGARDLVAPLTAANLKRATSLGSSHTSPAYGTKRFLMDGYTNTRPGRVLHMQASTPSLGADYHQGHARTHSDNALPERPHTALARGDAFGRKGRIPVRPSNSTWTDLRGSRSFDSLKSSDVQPPRESPAAMGTPDPDLEPLPEESASQVAPSVRDNRESVYTESAYGYGLGITRSPSTTDNLREQMSSLKGRISSLRDRAKEDSIRRQSYNSLKDASPLNNADFQAPDMWYSDSSSPAGQSPFDAQNQYQRSPSKPEGGDRTWGALPLKTGSRNAFAEMAAVQRSDSPSLRQRRIQYGEANAGHSNPPGQGHGRTGSRDMPGSFDTSDNEVLSDAGGGAQTSTSDAPTLSTPENPSEYFPDNDDESVYEDAEPDLPTSVVPHEEREDAFDYEHFFLHSAMARYQQSSSPDHSDTDSVSSTSTAKGPTTTTRDLDPAHYDGADPPDTPEALREIERKLAHSRSQSVDSVSTLASFATATEQQGRASPTPSALALAQVSKSHSRRSSRALSRPSSTDPQRSRRPPSDPSRISSSLRRSQGIPTPLLSPLLSSTPVADPTTVAVNALLNPQGRCLGLKDKALVFGVVESLRRVCEKLQEGEDEEGVEVGEARARLEGVRRALEGVGGGEER
ncbi:hypothetical protein WHR41_04055 [Cladosporium halotolerans]|uniref:Uncharacterized protein n=1 Tax=Cladosporium halotolerans TaxID=1052096 RepID=A0AB34KT77_9PEZI